MRVQISYHRINNLEESLNGDLAAKLGREYFPKIYCIENVTLLFHQKSTENVSLKVNDGLNA